MVRDSSGTVDTVGTQKRVREETELLRMGSKKEERTGRKGEGNKELSLY